jgi:hypothetical protein
MTVTQRAVLIYGLILLFGVAVTLVGFRVGHAVDQTSISRACMEAIGRGDLAVMRIACK